MLLSWRNAYLDAVEKSFGSNALKHRTEPEPRFGTSTSGSGSRFGGFSNQNLPALAVEINHRKWWTEPELQGLHNFLDF
jgi:hypothetical protein